MTSLHYKYRKGFVSCNSIRQSTDSKQDWFGKENIFDPILSRDSTISCGSCHHTDIKFTDGLQFSNGIDGNHTIRNAMTILNSAYQPYMFWDGGNPTLEQQVLAPIANPLEMDFDKPGGGSYEQSSWVSCAFPESIRSGSKVYTLTRAIACYERTLFTGFSLWWLSL